MVTRRPEISKTTIQVWFFLTLHVYLGLAAALPHTVFTMGPSLTVQPLGGTLPDSSELKKTEMTNC